MIKRFIYLYLSAMSFFLLTVQVFSKENISFDRLNSSIGLSHNSVTCFERDKKGNIWIGTFNGLNKFDGYTFEQFKNISGDPNSISGNHITVIYKDRDGNLWIGTRNSGLNKYISDRNIFKRYLHESENSTSINSNEITAITEDNRKTMYIGTAETGLNKFDKNSEKFFKFQQNGDFSNSISELLFDNRENCLWIGSTDAGLCRLNVLNNKIRIYKSEKNSKSSLSDDHISALLLDIKGELWIGTNSGNLNKYNKKSDNFFDLDKISIHKNPFVSKKISDIVQDNQGVIWIGVYGDGLIKYDLKKDVFQKIRHKESDPSSLSSNRILSLFQINPGFLWVGTDRTGICTFDKLVNEFSIINNTSCVDFNRRNGFVEALLEDTEGNFWVGYDNGLEKLNPISEDIDSRKAELIPGLKNSFHVTTMFEDKNSDVWIGTKVKGVYRYVKKTGEVISFNNSPGNHKSLSDNHVTAILRDSDSVLWIATRSGILNKYNDISSEFERIGYKAVNGHELKNISSLIEDSKNDFWIGTNGNGLVKYNKKSNSFKFFSHNFKDSASISSDRINSMHLDVKGNLWIATSNGVINKYDKEKKVFKHYSDNNYFKDDLIYSIVEDKANFLWFFTNNRIIKFDPVKIKYFYFDNSYWTRKNEIISDSGILGKRGGVFFGGTEGIITFDPINLTIPKIKSKVSVTSVMVNDKTVLLDKIDPKTGYKVLKLPSENTLISFTFVMIDFRLPYNNRYKYIFEGSDPKWTITEPLEYIQYDSLAPGEYFFRVKGVNHYGIWNDTGDVVKFIITPSFRQTIWFKLLVGLIFVGIFFGGYRWQTGNQRKRTFELEKKVLYRTKELRKKQEELEFAKDLMEISVNDRTRELEKKNVSLTEAIEELNAEIIIRFETEEALKQSEDKFRSIFEESWAMIFISTPKGKLIDINPAGIEMLGYASKKNILKKNLNDLYINPKKRVKIQKKLDKDGFIKNAEYQMRKKNGEKILVVESSTAVRDEEGKIINYRGMMRDVTLQKQKEEELTRAKENAEQANRSKNEFLANISHELRTPLNAVQGFAELILMEKSAVKTKNHAELILTESENLLSLIKQLLDVAKVESGKLELERLPFDLERLMESISASMRIRALQKSLSYDCEIEENTTVRFFGDPNRLRQILVNLIGNAIKFTHKGSIIVTCRQIQASEETVKLFFSIKDTGIGIPRDKQNLIFESFVQADGSTTRKYGGTGLGTTISKQLVELIGGEIGFESEVGKGSTFWFTGDFEKRYTTTLEEAAEQKLKMGKKASKPFTVKQKTLEQIGNVLLVEDYPTNQDIVTSHLSSVGYTVRVAENGKEAIQLTEENKFDVILMDVQMPIMGGYQATELIRSGTSQNTDVPIIALTANVYKKDRDKCYQAGMNDIIAKPFRRNSLLEKVNKWNNSVLNKSKEKTGKKSQKGAKNISKESDEPLNYEKVIQEFEGDRDLVDTLITEFIQDLESQTGLLNQACNQNDFETIRVIAHKIKGGASNLTAEGLADITKKLETFAESGDIKKINDGLEKMIAESKKLKNYFKNLKIKKKQEPLSKKNKL